MKKLINFLKIKKGDVSVVFIYVVSIIIIAFTGFLVIKFIISFSNISEDSTITVFYDKFSESYNKIKVKYGGMEGKKFKLLNKITKVCLIEDTKECNSEVLKSLDNTANIVLYENENIYDTKKIGNFKLLNSKCLCKNLTDSKKIEVIFENKKNKVYLTFDVIR